MKTHHSNQWWEAVLTESFRKHTFFQSWRGPMWDPFLQLGISYNVSMLCGEYHFSNWRSSCFVVKVHLANKKGTGTWEFWVTSPITDVKMRIHPRKLWWNLKKGPLDKEFSIYIHQFVGSILIDSGVYSISNFEPPPNFCIYIHTIHQWLYDWYATTTSKARYEKRCFKMFVSCRVMCVYIYIYTYLFFSCPRKFVWAKQNQAHLRPWRDLWGKSITQSICPMRQDGYSLGVAKTLEASRFPLWTNVFLAQDTVMRSYDLCKPSCDLKHAFLQLW